MSKHHSETLALLKNFKGVLRDASSEVPQDIGELYDGELPAALREWAALDRGVCKTLSNGDEQFLFQKPLLTSLGHGRQGLLFYFNDIGRKVALLDGSGDPSVLCSLDGETYVEHAKSFSDCIFAHIFDWRFRLEFDPEGYVRDMAYSPEIRLDPSASLARLSEKFRERVATNWPPFPWPEASLGLEERRFQREPGQLLTALSFHGVSPFAITLSAASLDLVGELEAEIIDLYSADIIPEALHSPHSPKHLLGQLSWRLALGWRKQIRRFCVRQPSEAALERLAECNSERSLHERTESTPHTGSETCVGGPAWGVTVRMRSTDPDNAIPSWWRIDEIVPTD